MSQSSELSRFQKYGEDILKKLKEYDSAIQNQSLQEDRVLTELRSQVETIRKLAREVKNSTSSEVKIAVMGEFNATKTTLLGSLLGYVGILPESEVATTGNVTHLRIVQVKGSQKTEFQFTVEYLDLAEVNECLDFMLKQLAKKALEARLSENLLVRLRSLTSKDVNIWVNVIGWCQEAIKSESTPGLKGAIKELGVFAASYRRYGKDMCGQSSAIHKDTARSGLQLPSNPTDVLKLKFDQIPPNKQRLPEFLQATFPLIRRINVEVKVSDKIWDLSSLQGANKLVLLDFPGLGASKSELRDQFLAVREMKNVQTILLLLDSTRPGSAKNYQIFDLLRQQRLNEDINDFILVGVGRFDDLPSAEGYIDKLLNDKEPLTEQKIFQEMPALREAIKNARDSTQGKDDRIVLLSAFVALEYGRKNLDSTIEIATARTWEKLSKFQNSFPTLHEKWKQLSERLKKSHPQSVLATWLDAFTKDGGITQLRYLLESHVVNHGLDQLYKDVRTKVKALCDEQKRLQQRLNNPSLRELLAHENPNLRTLRQALQELTDSYKALKTYLERNLLELGEGIDEKRTNIPLKQEIEDQVTSDIFSWSQWRTLLSKTENGIINLEQAEPKIRNPYQKSSNKPNTNIFTKSDDFYHNLFAPSCQNLENFTHKRIDQTLKDWLNELSNETVFLKETQRTINIKKQRDDIESCIQKKATLEEEIENLLYAASPSQWVPDILTYVNDNSFASIDPKLLFPLPLEEQTRGEASLMFDWSPSKRAIAPIEENHLITILQLRDVMIASISDKLVELVTETTTKANEVQKELLDQTIEFLQTEILPNRSLLRRMVGEEESQGAFPDWLEVLQEVINIRCPL
jgi:hypothetical protein